MSYGQEVVKQQKCLLLMIWSRCGHMERILPRRKQGVTSQWQLRDAAIKGTGAFISDKGQCWRTFHNLGTLENLAGNKLAVTGSNDAWVNDPLTQCLFLFWEATGVFHGGFMPPFIEDAAVMAATQHSCSRQVSSKQLSLKITSSASPAISVLSNST